MAENNSGEVNTKTDSNNSLDGRQRKESMNNMQDEGSGDEYANSEHKPEDTIGILRNAYAEKNLKLVDEIIQDMVDKSLVSGLKKLHTASGYGFAELVEKYIKEEKMDPNSECSFEDLTSITPLHFCAGIGPDAITDEKDKCIQILIDNGANVNHLTSRGGIQYKIHHI